MSVGGHSRRSVVGGSLCAATAATVVSTSSVLIPAYYAAGGNAQTFLIARYAMTMLPIIWFIALLGRPGPLSRRHLLGAMLAGVVFGLGSLFIFLAFARIPVSLAVLILFTFPILTVLIEAPLARRWPSVLQLSCLVVALGGLWLALGVGSLELDAIGILFAGLSAVGLASGYVIHGRWLADAHPAHSTGYMALTAAAVAVGFMATTGEIGVSGLGVAGWVALAAAATLSACGFALQFRSVQLVGPEATATIMNLEPILTMMLAALVLSEQLTAVKLVGAFLVVGAIFASRWIASRPKRAELLPPLPASARVARPMSQRS